MPRIRIFALTALFSVAPYGLAMANAENSRDSHTVSSVVTATTAPYNYDLENEPSACLNSNPRPNCGRKPELSGDRGGWMQYTVFGVMLAALGVIGTVLIRNVVKRDRAIAEQLANKSE